MTAYIFQSALGEYLRPRRILPWGFIAALVALVGFGWRKVLPDSSLAQQYGDVSSMLVFHIVALASTIFTTSIISQEIEQKTIVYLLTRPVKRAELILGRYLASAAAVALIGIVCALALSFTVFGGGGLANPILLNDFLAIILGSFAYGALFLMVSLISNRPILICMLIIGWDMIVSDLPGDLYRLSNFSYMHAIGQHPQLDTSKLVGLVTGNLGTNLVSASTGIATLAIVAVALTVLAMRWFTHFEYIPREDAG